MKVKELIEILRHCKQDHDVVLQKDSEGNGYEMLHCYEDGLMFNSKEGEVWTKEDYQYINEEVEGFLPNCLVLAP
jgi:hypothetical protein